MENDGNKSFSNLTNTYISRATGKDGLSNADIGLLALSFLRSGDYYYGSGALDGRGTYGYYWSLRGASGTGAYDLVFYSTRIGPQDGTNRGRGFALRCLAR